SAFCVIFEHIETRTGRTEQDRVPRASHAKGTKDRTLHRLGALNRHHIADCRFKARGSLSEHHRAATLCSKRGNERVVRPKLVPSASDQHSLFLGKTKEGGHGGAHIRRLGVIVEAHSLMTPRKGHPMGQRSKSS